MTVNLIPEKCLNACTSRIKHTNRDKLPRVEKQVSLLEKAV